MNNKKLPTCRHLKKQFMVYNKIIIVMKYLNLNKSQSPNFEIKWHSSPSFSNFNFPSNHAHWLFLLFFLKETITTYKDTSCWSNIKTLNYYATQRILFQVHLTMESTSKTMFKINAHFHMEGDPNFCHMMVFGSLVVP